MFGSFTIPTSRILEVSEDIADDACAKVLDLPDIFYPAVVVAVFNAALYDNLNTDSRWEMVYNKVDEYLEHLFEYTTVINRKGVVESIDERIPMIFNTSREMDNVIKYLSDTIVDGLAEYDLESNERWLDIVQSLKRDLHRLPFRPNLKEDVFTINLARKTLHIDM